MSVLGVSSLPDNLALKKEVASIFLKHGSFIYDVCDLVKNNIDNDFQASPLEAAEIFEKLTSSDAGERDGAAAVVGLTDLNEQLKMSFARLRR